MAEYPPALMSKKTAAKYCDMSVTFFLKVCPVKPIQFTQSARGSRYLTREIDQWLEKLSGTTNNAPLHKFGEKAGSSGD